MRSSRPRNRPAGVLAVVECVVDLYANRKDGKLPAFTRLPVILE